MQTQINTITKNGKTFQIVQKSEQRKTESIFEEENDSQFDTDVSVTSKLEEESKFTEADAQQILMDAQAQK